MRCFFATLVLAIMFVPACGSSSGGGGGSNPVTPTPQTIEGSWRATKAEFVSVANSARRVDIVAQGSTVTMLFAGGNYTYTQTEAGKPQTTQTGTWSASTDVMTLRPSGVTWNIQFDLNFSGNTLTMNGGSVQFDFNNGVFEEARLNMTLVRQ